MRFLKDIELNNYRNLKHAKLKNLRDLNIIIGPNNCGKTNLLNAVNMLGKLSFGRYDPAFSCEVCHNAYRKEDKIQSIKGSISVREGYLTRTSMKAVFGYNSDEIVKVLPELATRTENIMSTFRSIPTVRKHLIDEFEKEHVVVKAQTNRQLIGEHVSPVIWNEIIAKLFGHILFCPDERLQAYKGVQIPEHIKSKDFSMDEYNDLVKFLREVVDPKISSIRHSLDLVRAVENQRFNTAIAEQGSGVKSLICLVADILSATEAKMLLVDEPELGLNPSSKHAFLEFLIGQSEEKQIFLATHDPTFVNPILWNAENVSVYLFSLVNDEFVKVNLLESKEDPDTFAGYLPHTVGLKQVHMYVEGSLDVYIFQIFLDKYVKERFDKWHQVVNRIGVYHLAGDFWGHLLHTIPRRPYISIVVLDGDKRELAKQVVDKYALIEKGKFQIIDSPDKIKSSIDSTSSHRGIYSCPVYCLKRSEIEDYLKPRPDSKDEGPAVAYRMKNIPSEIELLFDAIFQMANIREQPSSN